MKERTFSRRQFLRSTAKVGMVVTLVAALGPPVQPALAAENSSILIPDGLDILKMPDVQEYLGAGVGALWVAGRFVSAFHRDLDFNNLPYELKVKYLNAGGEYKGFPAAEAIWKTIPAPIRAGGPEALWQFHQGKDWSHIIPRSSGGPTTAQNGVWWSSERNKSLGANRMSLADIADARKVLRSDAMRATVVQTINGMAKGAMVGIVVGAFLACLECGLQYAEGKITCTWPQTVTKIVESIIIAGVGATVVAGLIVGISLLFPSLIPILLPVIFVLQMASLVFLGRQVVSLAQGWWEVLGGQGLLESTTDILKSAQDEMAKMIESVEKSAQSAQSVMWDWVNMMASSSGLYWAWSEAKSIVQRMGIDEALFWFASQTQAVAGGTAYLVSSIDLWGYTPYIVHNGNALLESITQVVSTQFGYAISTTDVLLSSMPDYRKNANLNAGNSILVA